MPPRFETGKFLMTSGIQSAIVEERLSLNDLFDLVAAHQRLEKGLLSDDDHQANLRSLCDGSRLLSSFMTNAGRVWLITDAANDDGVRETTTICYPEEY